ncbi:hypothetical protein [Halobacterium rubrum]|nr:MULTISPECIES: hypothetical protein [Halobacterium]MDH5019592.1 hypothetical protein [Halobacterium rubrum]
MSEALQSKVLRSTAVAVATSYRRRRRIPGQKLGGAVGRAAVLAGVDRSS